MAPKIKYKGPALDGETSDNRLESAPAFSWSERENHEVDARPEVVSAAPHVVESGGEIVDAFMDSSHGRDWSQLQQDLLCRIFSRLDLPDLVYSGVICTYWHLSYSTVRRFRLCSGNLSPYLVYSSADRDSHTAALYNISTNKIYYASLPDPPFCSRFIVGSSQGWLVTADELFNLHLLNPISGAQITLPPAQCMQDVRPVFTEDGVVSGYYIMGTNEIHGPDFITAKAARHYLYHKVVLSSDPSSGECMVLLKHWPYHRLSFTRVGDTKWTWLEKKHCYDYHDIFYNGSDGLFYANRSSGEIHTIDLTSSPRAVDVVFSIVPRIFTQMSYILQAPWGDLLMVLHRYGSRPWDITSGNGYQANTQDSELSSDEEAVYIPKSIPISAKVSVHKAKIDTTTK
ncbi:hypothetical protein PR202_gb26246 [Eleusine coracana subsp. coracana]|uniref:KIB1-4 beta-propeller domain-containing protein n=1 Tax=Eleusine coracana subsp. coracana TaxID=191504 RepID=A0AAV5FR22_ELECO|nr:hypothetical protein PR202_gb26246 [Eleusine coracana subsp. coracana]